MTIKQFQGLDDMEKAEAVWDGTLLADYLELPFRYILYQVHAFYVDLQYHQENNVLTGMRAFDDTEELEPYLQQIKLHGEFGYPIAGVKELRDRALKMLEPETINQIMQQERERLVIMNFTLGVQLRNRLNLWHTVVVDKGGRRLHPDDVTLTILQEIWELGH